MAVVKWLYAAVDKAGMGMTSTGIGLFVLAAAAKYGKRLLSTKEKDKTKKPKRAKRKA